MALSPQHIDDFNADVSAWAKLTQSKLTMRLATLDLESKAEILQRARELSGRKKPLAQSLKSSVRKEFGQAEIIHFAFDAHGYYFDRGVGKGTKISQAGTTARIPKPWINFVLDDEMERLADLIVQKYGDDIVDQFKTKG